MIIKEQTFLWLYCIMNNKFKVQELVFSVDVDEHFWLNFSVDRFHEIEKAILKYVKVGERDRRWISEEEFENQYFCTSIQFQVLRKMKKNQGKRSDGKSIKSSLAICMV